MPRAVTVVPPLYITSPPDDAVNGLIEYTIVVFTIGSEGGAAGMVLSFLHPKTKNIKRNKVWCTFIYGKRVKFLSLASANRTYEFYELRSRPDLIYYYLPYPAKLNPALTNTVGTDEVNPYPASRNSSYCSLKSLPRNGNITARPILFLFFPTINSYPAPAEKP
jgi:hypothetical protein